jgi:hypothetical protein
MSNPLLLDLQAEKSLRLEAQEIVIDLQIEVQNLRNERDEARKQFNDIDLCQNAQAPCGWSIILNSEIAELRSVLEWYGEQARLCRLITSEGNIGRRALDADGGQRARTALAAKKPAAPAEG